MHGVELTINDHDMHFKYRQYPRFSADKEIRGRREGGYLKAPMVTIKISSASRTESMSPAYWNAFGAINRAAISYIYNLKQSSHQAKDVLLQGMEALQQSLGETLANGSEGSSGNVANYMGQMAMAMGKLGTPEGFLCQ